MYYDLLPRSAVNESRSFAPLLATRCQMSRPDWALQGRLSRATSQLIR